MKKLILAIALALIVNLTFSQVQITREFIQEYYKERCPQYKVRVEPFFIDGCVEDADFSSVYGGNYVLYFGNVTLYPMQIDNFSTRTGEISFVVQRKQDLGIPSILGYKIINTGGVGNEVGYMVKYLDFEDCKNNPVFMIFNKIWDYQDQNLGITFVGWKVSFSY
jgi:hypothetical protein